MCSYEKFCIYVAQTPYENLSACFAGTSPSRVGHYYSFTHNKKLPLGGYTLRAAAAAADECELTGRV